MGTLKYYDEDQSRWVYLAAGLKGDQGPPGVSAWGSITGSIADQTDLSARLTSIDTALASKADFPSTNNSIPIRGNTGTQGSIAYNHLSSNDTIVRRTSTGTVKGTTATAADDLTTKAQMDTGLATKLTTVSGPLLVYTTNSSSVQGTTAYSSIATGSTLMYRDGNGNSAVSEPTASGHIATKSYVDSAANGARAPRVESSASGSIVPNINLHDMSVRTAQAGALNIGAPTGTPTDGMKHVFRIKAAAAGSVAITMNAIYKNYGQGTGLTIPASGVVYIGVAYNAVDSSWDILAISEKV